MTPRLRQLFRDPPPLPPDAPAFVDAEAEEFYAEQQEAAALKMRIFDRKRAAVRRVDWVVGHINIAEELVKSGFDTPEKAEPEVRAMLEGIRGRR